MKCPECKKEIKCIYIITEYTQKGILEKDKVIKYEANRYTGFRTECPKCSEDISKYVKEMK